MKMAEIDDMVQYIPIEEEECEIERSFDDDVMGIIYLYWSRGI
jgi:hypothetical protein